MSVDSFKFVSPGVFVNEIDNTGRPDASVGARGPAIIGRLERGPGNRPVTVESFSEFIEIFGNPIPGGRGGDVWREGNYLAPTYAAYAAQAYLRNSSPITVVRVLGEAHPDAVSGGEAGWKVDNSHAANTDVTPVDNGGAFGLFLFSSGSHQIDQQGAFLGDSHPVVRRGRARATGSLAAVWYFDEGAIELSGALHDGIRAGYLDKAGLGDGRTALAGNGVALKSSNIATMEFTAVLFDASNVGKKVSFNFDRSSDKYIRKVFNTNPTLCGTTTAISNTSGYWLGETFDRHARDLHSSGTLHQGNLAADPSLYGVIVGLEGTTNWGSNQISTQPAKTGWFFGQDLSSNTTKFDAAKQQKLFRVTALDDGAWASRNIKVSISDLRAPTEVDPYGSFTVTLRHVRDHDGAIKTLEKFANCNLNPNSRNYVGIKIGDMYQEWSDTEKRFRMYGQYPNNSRFVRVEVNSDVEEGITDPALLPFGFYGPPRYKKVDLSGQAVGKITGSTVHASSTSDGGVGIGDVESALATGSVFLSGSNNGVMSGSVGASPFKTTAIFAALHPSSSVIAGIPADATKPHPRATVLFPSLPLRVSSSDDSLRFDKMAHFGITTTRSPSSKRFEESYWDVVAGGKGIAADAWDAASNTEYSFIFTLDDLVATNAAATSVRKAHYASGSRKAGTSYTALRSGYTDLIKSGFTKFTSPMYGGFDGLDIKEREPFGHHILGASGLTLKSNYAANSLKLAIDAVAEPEVVDINGLVVPGVRAPIITDHMLTVCEDRGDALAIIDVENNGYQPSTETTDSFKTRITNNNVTDCVNNLKTRGLNTSYGCAYFPWVKIQDEIAEQQVWVPPSVVALGTFANTERNHSLWFAPAGFTRGGLSNGAAGLPVLGVSQRLSAQDRDELYEHSINPIAQFPAEGIVIFGQKTLMATPSALDRINVRRLMIYVKKEISRTASVLLFDQNVQSTWNRFKGQIEPFLASLKARLGLDDFKVVLDSSTTTADLVDRNIMYAKVFLKPTKALEFIAIDFIVTNNGAAFED